MRGIEIRQFTHSAEIKREIPFFTRKRSETYILENISLSLSLVYFKREENDNISSPELELVYFRIR